VVGIIFISGNFTGNAYFKNEIGSSFLTCNFTPSVIVRRKILKALATVTGSFTFSLFIRRGGICSAKCIFPVSRFTMFHVVFILLSDFAISLHSNAAF
jgi:hypothetical protein